MRGMKQLVFAETRANRLRGLFLVTTMSLAPFYSFAWQAQNPPPTDLKSPGFQEFSDRVQKYVQLHKSVEGTLPKLKSTNEPELIEAHQKMLTRKIKAARIHAKRGDIFTPAAAQDFRKALSTEFQGPHSAHAQATMKQGAPLKQVHVRVNQVYPASVPYTSVPPTLLQKLPPLPAEVAYRAVSNDLVLLDVKTNLVLDYLIGVIPAQEPDHQ
jgi:hypothetical protein